jgi:cob(I)alamin adenosyltransferase
MGVIGRDCKHGRIRQWLAPAVIAVFVTTGFWGAPAGAIEQFTVADHPFWTIDEVRAGVFKQAIDDAPHEGTAALNLEVLGGRFPGGYENSILNFLLTPRPDLGTTIAFGKTDEFYWGVTWDAKLFDRTFFEATFGGAAHDGPINELGHASYGCVVNFREGASLGYEFAPHLRVMAIIDHMSNAGLCNPNPNRGLTNAGIRLGYRW